MKEIKDIFCYCVIPLALLAGGFFLGHTLWPRDRRIEIPMVEEIKVYFTNELVQLKTVYVPVKGDTERYTNLYTNTIELYRESTNLINIIEGLNNQIRSPRVMAGGGYISTYIPLSIGGGIEYGNICVTAGIGLSSNLSAQLSSLNVYWRF